MAYDYDADILAALWTGAEDGEEPYASFIAANPDITNEVAENRILSTIELLRSHMELLQTREEAKLLHESISKLIRHSAGGSNPWSEAAAVTDAVGNVNNPQFPAGASVDVIIDGATTSASSATGGDCKTVADELNATLDGAAMPAVVERRSTDTAGTTVQSLSGTYFTMHSANDATEYYVWFNWSGQAERTRVTPLGDSEGSLGGTYFTLNSTNDATNYYVWMNHAGRGESVALVFAGVTGGSLPTGAVPAAWFDVTSTTATYRFWFSDGSTTPPAVTTETLVPIAFTGAEIDTAITGLAHTAITGADADFASFIIGGGTTISGTLATVGDVTDPVDGAVSTGATIGTVTQGLSPAVDPAPGGLTAIPVTYALDEAASEIGNHINTAVGGNADFSATGSSPVDIDNATIGPATDAADVDTGFTIATLIDGGDASVDPAPGGLTALPIALSGNLTDAEIGNSMRVAIGANADFFTEGGGTTVQFDNVDTGPTTDAVDVDTGLTITTTQQGADASGDATPVTAICVFPGPRLGFRAQEDFLTFSLSNGAGGVIGPAGIIPGERASSPKRVADQGRDLALNHYAGTPRPADLTP